MPRTRSLPALNIFCAYGPVTAGREYAAVDISSRTLHEVHLPSFAAAWPPVSPA